VQLLSMILIGIICIACGYFLQYNLFAGEDSGAPIQPARVEINEMMSRNVSVLPDEYGLYTDWIEIINREQIPVNIAGWQLLTVDKMFEPFIFPELILQPGEAAIVFACGREQKSTLHAAFKLSSSGEEVVLLDPAGMEADSVVMPDLEEDQSYARMADGAWEKVFFCTPGMENLEENAVNMQMVVDDAICISEVIPCNASLIAGGSDLIELMNTSSRPVSLEGYALSDDKADPYKYVLGSKVLSPGECILIQADGKNVSFKLAAEGEQVVLTTPSGETAGFVEWEMLEPDVALSWVDGEWTRRMTPTPGYANTQQNAAFLDAQLTAANPDRLFISELMVSGVEDSDWVELYNAGSSTIDLAGYGLSDDPQSPRQWQFPAGTRIKAGEYLVVYLSARDQVDRYNKIHTNFKMSCVEPETLTLCRPDGTIIDKAYMPEMYGDVSIGRKSQGGFAYLAECTPGEANSRMLYDSRAKAPEFSVKGGIFDDGERVQLTLSAQPGTHIYYTLDSSDPTQESMLYTGPITLTDTTIVRAAVFGSNVYPSYIETQSYLFGIDHTVRVVSVVSDPEGLFSDETGIMVLGANALNEEPYTGANFWQEWERGANVEIFETDGTTMVSQGCSVRLHGANSRKRSQKSLVVSARLTYDEKNRFHASLFSDRDYTEYQSFVLRACGQDGEMSRLRDTVIGQLTADTRVFYQESEICVVYINGEYWGHYDMREKANRFAMAAFEGWEDSYWTSIVVNHDLVVRGSDQTYAELMEWIAGRQEATDADIAYVETIVDLDNYLDWMCIMIYSANQDVGLRRYRNTEAADDRWKWVLFDLDYAFYNDTDSVRRWLDPAGAGAHNVADNRLFVYVMKNPAVRDRFLTRFGQLVTGPWRSENVVAAMQAQYELMLPEMSKHFERWTEIDMDRWQKYVDKLIEYAGTRDEKVIGYAQAHFGLSDAEMARYFGR